MDFEYSLPLARRPQQTAPARILLQPQLHANHRAESPKCLHSASFRLRSVLRKLQRVLLKYPNFKCFKSRDRNMLWCGFYQREDVFPCSGWKIHLSFSLAEWLDFLFPLSLALFSHNVAGFKMPATLESFRIMSSGEGGASQTGKIITIYPRDAQNIECLLSIIDDLGCQFLGPSIPSDRWLNDRGTLGIRFGAFRSGITTDEVGKIIQTTIIRGRVVEDVRNTTGQQPEGAPALPLSIEKRMRSIRRPPDRLQLPDWKTLALIYRAPKGSVWLAIRKGPDIEVAICKTARRSILLGDAFTTACRLLENEYQVLRYLQGLNFTSPYPLQLLRTDHENCLMTTDTGGHSLANHSPVTCSLIAQCIKLVSKIHEYGICHRDIKPDNFLIDGEKIHLIDYELAAPLSMSSGFAGGTPEFCPRGQRKKVTRVRDLFGLAGTLFFFAYRESPVILPFPEKRSISLLRNTHGQHHSRWIRLLLEAKEDSASATLEQVARELSMFAGRHLDQRLISKDDHCNKPETRQGSSIIKWARRTSWNVGQLIRKTCTRKKGAVTLWKSPKNRDGETSMNLAQGSAGVLLGLSAIDAGLKREDNSELIVELTSRLARFAPFSRTGGLFTGNAGIALVLIILGKRFSESRWIERGVDLLTSFRGKAADDPDLYFGGSGIIFCASIAASILDSSPILDSVADLAHLFEITMQVKEGMICWENSGRLSGKGPPFLGAAHGSAGTALALATYGRARKNKFLIEKAWSVFRSILLHGKTRSQMQICDQIGRNRSDDAPFLWCRGVGGVLWSFLSTSPPIGEYGPEIEWAIGCLEKGPAIGNSTLCHGLAGRLDLFRMLKSFPIYRERGFAGEKQTLFALRTMSTRRQGFTCWTSETRDIVAPELWTGYLGPAVACLLSSLSWRHPLLSWESLHNLANTGSFLSQTPGAMS